MDPGYASRRNDYEYSLREHQNHDSRITDLQATVSGALAWLLATWATQPMEMVRMHQQLGTTIGEQGALAAALALMKGQTSMFRGTFIGWTKTFPEFLVKNLVLSSMRTNAPQAEPSVGGMLPRVLASTICARLITYPFEVCKLRAMQYEGSKPYTGLYDTGRRIVIEEGFLALYKGLSMGLAANIVYSITMSLISPWTHAIASQFNIPTEISMQLSRLVSMFTSYPFETLKRRLASNCDWVPITSLPASSPAQLTPIKLFSHILSTDWTQLWAGFPLLASSLILKSVLVRTSQHYCNRIFMWNNGYTVGAFDPTPIPGIPQYVNPDDLLRRKRLDNRI
jgi:hypothetical protein